MEIIQNGVVINALVTASETEMLRTYTGIYRELRATEKLLQAQNASKFTQDAVRSMRRKIGAAVVAEANRLATGEGRAE